MLWLCLHFPRLPAEALGLRDVRDAVTAQHGARSWLISEAAGIPAGTALATALSLRPQLRAHVRKPKAEHAMLRALAHGLYRYGSPVHAQIRELDEPGRVPQALLWIEIGASLRLFGGWPALRAQIFAALAEQQQPARCAVAPSRSAAALFASCAQECVIDDRETLQNALAALPLQALLWPAAEIEALQGVGLRRLGQLFDLPRTAFARRHGPQRLRELDQLRGLAAEPAQAIVPPARFRRRFELPGESESLESLLFPLRRLTLELQAWLRACDTGVLAVRLHCEHAQNRRTTQPLRFQSAHRDAQRLFDALRERLQRTHLPGPVRALELRSAELAPAVAASGDLFAAAHERGDWQAALERITARLGEAALWQPVHHADHRPERAHGSDQGEADAGMLPPRPLWLLHHALPLPAAPQLGENPERIESGWWDGGDVRRDYHLAEWQNAQAWVFRELGRDAQRWFLHGLWG